MNRILRFTVINKVSTKGLKNWKLPPEKRPIVYPPFSSRFLPVVPKTPPLHGSSKMLKMTKRLDLIRGPETVHTELLHRQFGVRAVTGGQLRQYHFRMMKRVLDFVLKQTKDSFAIFRMDPPWKPCTQRKPGTTLGGGRGSIKFYVTPVKSGRILLEVGGSIEWNHIQKYLKTIANTLPFEAEAVSYESMLIQKENDEKIERENINKFSFKYALENNMMGCHSWASPYDFKWFGKYR
ncbi:39S ribosomal protein L16, mitochondrial [Intoshia linei]|uniref:Large ribosomal subunit protein uL16m n=1 Tax=Intoshia linei TaxID=1819745 RepID=A0A177B8G0_9BILA|nr:39S ribosomal protein L16, mitochondrial [Intoshia linei]